MEILWHMSRNSTCCQTSRKHYSGAGKAVTTRSWVDQMVAEDAAMQGRHLAVAWVDYAKAYDNVPHPWIKRMLKCLKAPRVVRKAIRRLMRKWQACFHHGEGASTRPIVYKRGLYQGKTCVQARDAVMSFCRTKRLVVHRGCTLE